MIPFSHSKIEIFILVGCYSILIQDERRASTFDFT
jgi:Na+-driven multidrug efflux pump